MPLPDEILTLLQNSRYVHLGTCSDNIPHVSLMNYTYVEEGSPYEEDRPAIVLTSKRDANKVKHISSNPNVSILIHDWTTTRRSSATSSGLARMIQDMNQTEMSSRSATLSGTATVVEDKEKHQYFLNKHLEGCAKEALNFTDSDMVVILVHICGATVVDVENHVQTYQLD